MHQFEKVEQFVICEADADESASWHAALLDSAEGILQSLGLHYEVVECATGDMGMGKFRMNDINTWFPSLNMLRETHSCSTLHDWQARRANLRYRDTDGTIKFAHTLNNTAVATPRLLAAVIENYQTKDHEVRVPEVLRPYLATARFSDLSASPAWPRPLRDGATAGLSLRAMFRVGRRRSEYRRKISRSDAVRTDMGWI